MTSVVLSWPLSWLGYQDLNLGPLPYQGVGVPARTAALLLSWVYGRTTRFSYLAVSFAYTRGPWRSRAVVGPALGPGALLIRRNGQGVQGRPGVWPCAGSMFRACWCESSFFQRVGSRQVDEETASLSATGRSSLDHRPAARSTGARLSAKSQVSTPWR
jgi:hypothetical protein